jgi:succinoglycan biosynthesis transport protein ExoP
MQRETEGRRVALETEAVDEYPQIEVIEPAYAPRDPISPNYLRDLGISAAGGAAAGLLTVLALLLIDAKSNARRPAVPVTGVRIWSDDRRGGIGQDPDARTQLPRGEAMSGLAAPPLGALPDASLRQLMGGEVEALWDLAGDDERQLIGLLLSGLRLEELGGLGETTSICKPVAFGCPAAAPAPLPWRRAYVGCSRPAAPTRVARRPRPCAA